MSSRPAAVLFVCNFNRVRSPMAEGLTRKLYGDAIFVDSCGLVPAEGLDPLMLQAMAEAGVDLAEHRPKGFEAIDNGSFDLVVSFTPQSQHRAAELSRGQAVEIEYWPVIDPTLTEGSREAALEGYREALRQMEAKIRARFGPPPGTEPAKSFN